MGGKSTKGLKKLEADIEQKFRKYGNYDKRGKEFKDGNKGNKQNKSYIFIEVEAKWQPVQSLTRLVLLLVRIRTGIPSNWGSTG